MDALTEVLNLLRTKGQFYGRLELTSPFGLEFPGGKGICLMVTRGSCFLGVDDQPVVPLVGGDFVFLPSSETYSLRSAPEVSLRPVSDVSTPGEFYRTRLISHGGGGMATAVIAGCFTFATPESEWLVKSLPPIVRVSASAAHATPWFQATLQFIASEIAQEMPGSATIVDRLAEVLFVQALRTQIHSPCQDENPSWLRALGDRQIGEALHLMHSDPGHMWTVPELAHCVSMSRSAFAARFRELVGATPLDHLTQWRMVRAASMIRDDRSLKLAAVASAVGYDSEGAFGKTFRRVIGVTPGRYREESL